MKLWIFLGGYRRTGLFLFLELFLNKLGFFLKVKIQNWNFFGLLTFNDFWGDA